MKEMVEAFRKAMVEVLVPEIRQLRDEMRAMREEMNQRFDGSNGRFAALEQSIAVLKAQGEAHQKLTQHVLDRLDVRERVATLETQMAMVMERVCV